MKIISLNTYSGVVFEPLMKFIKDEAQTTDVFCFQEVTNADHNQEQGPRDPKINLFSELQNVLQDFEGFFEAMEDNFAVDKKQHCKAPFGLAMFVRKGMQIKEREAFFICNAHNTFDGHDYATLGHAAMRVTLEANKKNVHICTVHGIAFPADKLDNDARIGQSQIILDHMKNLTGEKIILGDFNLLPETRSIQMFKEAGYRNLIEEFEIPTTRGSYIRVLYPEYEHGTYGFQEFADYAFITPGVVVQHFQVPHVSISDHLPMILEIQV